jgi:hypothetical protein
VSLDAAIADAIEAGLRERLPALLAELGQRSRLISIDELPVSPRLVRAAAKRGEIKIYTAGKFRAVDEAEFFAWVKRGATKSEPKDEADDLIQFAQGRRRGGRAA